MVQFLSWLIMAIKYLFCSALLLSSVCLWLQFPWMPRHNGLHAHTHTYTHTHIHTYTHTHIHTYTYTHIHIYTYTHIHIYTYTHIHTHTHTYTHIHTHTHTYTHIHTHTHTHTQNARNEGTRGCVRCTSSKASLLISSWKNWGFFSCQPYLRARYVRLKI